MYISRLCTTTWLRRPLCNTWTIRNHRKIEIMHSVKLGYLMSAVTVHLLLFLFGCHDNKEYVCACLCTCVCTCTCDLSSKREHQPKEFGRSRSPGIETHAHSHTILTRNLFLRFRTCIRLTK